MKLEIRPITPADVEGFHAVLDAVARERFGLAMWEAPPLESTREFVQENVASGAIQFVAVDAGRVVAWADVITPFHDALRHRGGLGIGMLPAYRGQGLGRRLLEACIAAAWAKGLVRIQLEVRADNAAGIALYKRCGFVEEGRRRMGMRTPDGYVDTIAMALLRPA